MGHELVVFASTGERPKGRLPIKASDEPFVYRNWEMYRYGDRIRDDEPLDLFFDAKPMLKEGYDVLFIEKPTCTPLSKLSGVFNDIKERARVAAIMHEGRIPIHRRFYGLRWDAASVFDERFMRLYGHLLNAEKVAVVPYPCHPIALGSRGDARAKLGLPEEKKMVLAFGLRANALWPIMPILAKVARNIDMCLLILVEHEKFLGIAEALRAKYDFVLLRIDAPSFEDLYTYLHASDAVLLHRPAADYVPVSSSVHLCLGSLRPILCPDNNFFEKCDGVLKYSGPEDLEDKLRLALEEGLPKEVMERALRYIKEREPRKVARELLDLTLS